ncbi:MAG: dTDP-glucose 4,6-dehydratase [Alphaproteobacteria bacterium]|nr:MAG: dTDP-glucose 4,6-dehydratase [Alphaproteobacteria bacterium]TAF41282.1 MAG: dTDP-glucose 4,6-dehydratase [Alphaproteobacteria bacterium]TAF76283.1 MAG: dTDP-glucose 4,6-dehydratase [Alphaproteobacteria bacterium]
MITQNADFLSSLFQQTYLVTGGAGFIGSTAVAQMVHAGAHVVVVDALTYAGFRENLEWIPSHPHGGSYELVEGSITDGALISQLLTRHRPCAIINFAAESHVDNSIESPSQFMHTNIIGTYTMLEAARHYWNHLEAGEKDAFRFIQISTDEVYGSLGETGKFHEEYPMQPNSPYSASKAAGDHLARAWFHTYGLPTIITNCTNNYGPRQYPEKLIPLMIHHALAGKDLPIYGDGRNIRDWIHVEDHCMGVLRALTLGTVGESYGFGGNAEKTNMDVVHNICDLLDEIRPRPQGGSYREQIRFVKDRLGHDRRYAIDDSKAIRELGFMRSHDFAHGIRATIAWYLDNQAWCESVTRDAAHKRAA